MTDEELIKAMSARLHELMFEWHEEFGRVINRKGQGEGDFARLDAIRAQMDEIEDLRHMVWLASGENGQGGGGNLNDNQDEEE